MAERGGPSAQSGILYQNSVAALFLGRLCDMHRRAARDSVVEVRVEAPAHVDDIVVRFADGHTDWVQAKETLRRGGQPWKQLWADFAQQRWSDEFDEGDRLVLVAGAVGSNTHEDLQKLWSRAEGAADASEWKDRLSTRATLLLADIRELVTPQHQDDASLFDLFRCAQVWPPSTLEQIERDELPRWMPQSGEQSLTLFSLLRDKVGGHARSRKVFRAADLLEQLAADHGIAVREPPGYGVHAYRRALAELHSTLNVPGTPVSGDVETLFVWPTLCEAKPELLTRPIEEDEFALEADAWDGESVDLRDFPHLMLRRAVIVAGAGFGKTALLRALAWRLSGTTWLPALVSLPELVESRRTVIGFLTNKVNRDFNVGIPWERYCERGLAVVLFDGLDELAPSDRADTFESIRLFAARYNDPRVAWLLTVRDPAALPAAPGANLMTIDPLNDEQMRVFAEAYRKAGSPVEPTHLLSQLQRHKDLEALARIPLFLALLMVTEGRSQDLPRNRAQLIERYLHILLHPVAYKRSIKLHCDATELRVVAERIAFGGLEDERAALADRDVERVVTTLGTRHTSEEYIDDLVACGLIRRSFNLISFPFPIVQEYLAACFLVAHLPDEVGQRFKLSVRRPWAQALQFALERHPKADDIVNQLLEEKDDAFGTVLRLLARCIINGAPVSEGTRDRVGDRLADLWMSPSGHVAATAGRLLADGFTSPLPSAVQRALASGRGFTAGGAEILTAAKDPDLTRRALIAFLDQDLEYHYYLHSWQTAVDSIASEALQYYIARVKSHRTSAREIEPLASLIRNLSCEALPAHAFESVANDEGLPDMIRLAGYLLGPRPLLPEALRLADHIIRAPTPEEAYRVPGWRLAMDALWSCDNPVERWRAYVCGTCLGEERHRELLFALPDSLLDRAGKLAAYAGLRRECSLSTDSQHSVLLMQAYLGDSSAMDEATALIPYLSFHNLESWALVASQYPSSEVVLAGLRDLPRLPLDAQQRSRMASSLAFGLTMDVEFAGGVGGSLGRKRIRHVAASECAEVVWRWVAEYEGDKEGRLLLLTAACELGHPEAAEVLEEELAYLAYENAALLKDFGFDHTVSNALYGLVQAQRLPPLEFLERCAEISDSNTAIHAISMIASHTNPEALTTLLRIFREKRCWEARDSIVPHIEALGTREGVRFMWDGDFLVPRP